VSRNLENWLEYIDAVHPQDIKMGLDRVTEVADRLDVRRPAEMSVIVAGTNGKGSTCMATERLLLEAGRRVGTTLSPHVSRFNERIRIDGAEIGDEELCQLFAEVDRVRGEIALTYFEFSTLAALLAFKRSAVDVAVLEVGLGGRLDAFNLVDADVAVVTSIGLDHEDYLGTDLETIGREKAGVFRPGQSVVVGRVTQSVIQAAEDLDCRIHHLDRDFAVRERCDSWSYSCESLGLDFVDLPRGVLAPSNCAIALTVAALITGRAPRNVEMLAEISFAGRMEEYDFRGTHVLVDVAHNPAAAEFLAAQLESRFPGKRYVAVLGMLKDKDALGVTAALGGLVRRWLTIPTLGWRAQTSRALAEKLDVPGLDVPGDVPGIGGPTSCESLTQAMDKALSLTAPGDGILVAGSFSAVEQARKLLKPGN